MNPIASHAIAVVIGGAFIAGGCAYLKFTRVPLPSALLQPAKELDKEKPTLLKCKPVLVYRDKVEAKLGLPETVKRDPDKHVVASSNVPPSDYPHTMTAVYDSGTGGVDMFLRRDRLPWVAFNQKGSIGVSYGVKNSTTGSVSRLYGRFDLIQIKRLHAGILGDVDTDGDKYGGAFAEYRW